MSASLAKGWSEVRIEALLEPQSDGRLLHHGWSPQCEAEPARTEEWGVLKTTAVQSGSFLAEHNKRLPASLAPRPLLAVSEGDLLLTCAGPRNRCGVACLVRHAPPRRIISGKMYRFRVSTRIADPRFVEHFLLSTRATKAIDAMKTGISDSGLNLTHDRFLKLVVPVAPLQEQVRVIEAVDSFLSQLDAAVASLKNAQAKLSAYRASVLKAAVEGRLVPTEAELAKAEGRSFEPADKLLERILEERRRVAGERHGSKAKYVEPRPPLSSGERSLPAGWTTAAVVQLGFVQSGQTPAGIADCLTPTGEVPWFRVGDMNSIGNDSVMSTGSAFLSKADAKSLGIHIRPPGTIIFPKRGGAIATNKKRKLLASSAYDLNTMGISPVLCDDYFWLWFTTVDLATIADGSNVPQINHGDIEPLVVPLPPLAEQARITAEAGALLSVADRCVTEVRESLQRCARLRQSILKAAFEGKLVDQDPNDEPASELLARLRAQTPDTAAKPKRGRKTKTA